MRVVDGSFNVCVFFILPGREERGGREGKNPSSNSLAEEEERGGKEGGENVGEQAIRKERSEKTSTGHNFAMYIQEECGWFAVL